MSNPALSLSESTLLVEMGPEGLILWIERPRRSWNSSVGLESTFVRKVISFSDDG